MRVSGSVSAGGAKGVARATEVVGEVEDVDELTRRRLVERSGVAVWLLASVIMVIRCVVLYVMSCSGELNFRVES